MISYFLTIAEYHYVRQHITYTAHSHKTGLIFLLQDREKYKDKKNK